MMCPRYFLSSEAQAPCTEGQWRKLEALACSLFGLGDRCPSAWHPAHPACLALPRALLAQVDIPPNPSWVPWPRRAGRNSLGILGVLRHPAFLPAGLWQGGLLDTWLDAALHTPSGEGVLPESTGGTCEGHVFWGRQSNYKQWFFVWLTVPEAVTLISLVRKLSERIPE